MQGELIMNNIHFNIFHGSYTNDTHNEIQEKPNNTESNLHSSVLLDTTYNHLCFTPKTAHIFLLLLDYELLLFLHINILLFFNFKLYYILMFCINCIIWGQFLL